jgi:hypothetical protein
VFTDITFIVTPRSINMLCKEIPLISMVTIGFPRSVYLEGISVINSDNYPTTCMIGGSFLFLPEFLMQSSLTILA